MASPRLDPRVDAQLKRPASDCTIIGTPGPDVLRGTPHADVICGLRGNDLIFGGGGRDVLRGGPGNDRIRGGAGGDVLRGGAPDSTAPRRSGEDDLRGGRGPDRLFGGDRADHLVGGKGSDILNGGPGADRLDARDGAGFVDRVSCGAGRSDVALADPHDRVGLDCESYPGNRPPTGLQLSKESVRENRPARTTVGRLSAVDPNVGDRLTFRLVSGAGGQDNGSFRIEGRRLVTKAVFDFETKSSYSVRIRVSDPRGAGGSKRFTISVIDAAENVAPVATGGTFSIDEDSSVSVDLTTLASDAETASADLTFTATAPAHGTLSGNGGTRSYTPHPDFNGTDTFTYTATDLGNPDNCSPGPGCAPPRSATGTVRITVHPVNDAPTATGGTRTTDEDTPLALNLGALVSDVETSDANLTYTIVDPPAHGTVTGTGTATTYTPEVNFNGTDSLTYKITDRGDPDSCGTSRPACDAPKTSTTQTVTIRVTAVNDAPATPDATRTTDEDTPLSIDLSALAHDVETSDANLTFTVTPPAHGTMSGSGGTRTYTPDGDFNGTDTFTYTVTDRGEPDNCGSPGPQCAAATSATGTITVTVNPVNDAPINTLPPGPIPALPDTDTPISGLSIADVDAGTDQIELTLSVAQGTLTLDTSHLDPAEIAGNGTATVVVTASLAAINQTLGEPDGVVFHGTTNDTLTMTTYDLGHNGSGGPKADADTVPIVLNGAPVAAD